jgi:hypothetical protein
LGFLQLFSVWNKNELVIFSRLTLMTYAKWVIVLYIIFFFLREKENVCNISVFFLFYGNSNVGYYSYLLFFLSHQQERRKTYDVLNKIQKKQKWYMDSFLTFRIGNNNAYHLSSAKFSLRCVLSSSRQYRHNYLLENVPMVILRKHNNRHLCVCMLHKKKKEKEEHKLILV